MCCIDLACWIVASGFQELDTKRSCSEVRLVLAQSEAASANASMSSRGGGGGEELSFALTLTGMRKTILGRNDTLIKFFYMVFSNSTYIIEKFLQIEYIFTKYSTI